VAFRKLKKVFIIQPVLVAPDLNREIGVKVDTSEYTMERILLTKCKNSK